MKRRPSRVAELGKPSNLVSFMRKQLGVIIVRSGAGSIKIAGRSGWEDDGADEIRGTSIEGAESIP